MSFDFFLSCSVACTVHVSIFAFHEGFAYRLARLFLSRSIYLCRSVPNLSQLSARLRCDENYVPYIDAIIYSCSDCFFRDISMG
jgi:hypothetical protein